MAPGGEQRANCQSDITGPDSRGRFFHCFGNYEDYASRCGRGAIRDLRHSAVAISFAFWSDIGIARKLRLALRRSLSGIPLTRISALRVFYRAVILSGLPVHRDSYVEVDKSYYAVPSEYIGRTVWARWDNRCVRLFNQRWEQIRLHAKLAPGQFTSVLGIGGFNRTRERFRESVTGGVRVEIVHSGLHVQPVEPEIRSGLIDGVEGHRQGGVELSNSPPARKLIRTARTKVSDEPRVPTAVKCVWRHDASGAFDVQPHNPV
jgi:hypothetical protein